MAIRAISIEAVVAVPWVVPIEIVETTHPTAVCIVILLVEIRSVEDLSTVLSTGMELNDIITQRVGSYNLISALHGTPVVLIDVPRRTIISRSILTLRNRLLSSYLLGTLLRGEVEVVVLCLHYNWKHACKDCQ